MFCWLLTILQSLACPFHSWLAMAAPTPSQFSAVFIPATTPTIPFLSANSCLFPVPDISWRLALSFGYYLASFATLPYISFPAPILAFSWYHSLPLKNGLLKPSSFQRPGFNYDPQEEPLLDGWWMDRWVDGWKEGGLVQQFLPVLFDSIVRRKGSSFISNQIILYWSSQGRRYVCPMLR